MDQFGLGDSELDEQIAAAQALVDLYNSRAERQHASYLPLGFTDTNGSVDLYFVDKDKRGKNKLIYIGDNDDFTSFRTFDKNGDDNRAEIVLLKSCCADLLEANSYNEFEETGLKRAEGVEVDLNSDTQETIVDDPKIPGDAKEALAGKKFNNPLDSVMNSMTEGQFGDFLSFVIRNGTYIVVIIATRVVPEAISGLVKLTKAAFGRGGGPAIAVAPKAGKLKQLASIILKTPRLAKICVGSLWIATLTVTTIKWINSTELVSTTRGLFPDVGSGDVDQFKGNIKRDILPSRFTETIKGETVLQNAVRPLRLIGQNNGRLLPTDFVHIYSRSECLRKSKTNKLSLDLVNDAAYLTSIKEKDFYVPFGSANAQNDIKNLIFGGLNGSFSDVRKLKDIPFYRDAFEHLDASMANFVYFIRAVNPDVYARELVSFFPSGSERTTEAKFDKAVNFYSNGIRASLNYPKKQNFYVNYYNCHQTLLCIYAKLFGDLLSLTSVALNLVRWGLGSYQTYVKSKKKDLTLSDLKNNNLSKSLNEIRRDCWLPLVCECPQLGNLEIDDVPVVMTEDFYFKTIPNLSRLACSGMQTLVYAYDVIDRYFIGGYKHNYGRGVREVFGLFAIDRDKQVRLYDVRSTSEGGSIKWVTIKDPLQAYRNYQGFVIEGDLYTLLINGVWFASDYVSSSIKRFVSGQKVNMAKIFPNSFASDKLIRTNPIRDITIFINQLGANGVDFVRLLRG